jgi:F-type H+-transporting ATPase subunit b
MKIKYLFLLVLPVIASASEASHEGGTDFWWRLFNFIIFAIIVYRLVGDKIVDFFKARSKGIADELNSIQEQLKEAKQKKAEAKEKATEAGKKAEELIEVAKEEAQLISKKIIEDADFEKETLSKSLEERMQIETKKMKEEVVESVIESLFDSKEAQISNKDLLNIIKKKVA